MPHNLFYCINSVLYINCHLLCKVMENLYENRETATEFSQTGDATKPDFSPEELCILKTMFLELEKAIDDMPVKSDGSTFHGGFIVELLAKAEVCSVQ